MYRFAHLSDIHIGAFGQPRLRQLVVDAFTKALDECIKCEVDFIVIPGDLFDSNLPDMAVVEKTVKKMKEIRDAGIEIYVVYGSHDFSPNQSSMVDVLESAGLFKKVTKGQMVDNRLVLEFYTDRKTGAKLTGISGRKAGTDREFFSVLDRDALEKEPGFKIFLFHGALAEYKPQGFSEMESMPLSNLPKGFNYYAGGHIHETSIGKMSGFDNVVYPGTLFGGDYRDLEKSARGQKRGFYIISFSDKVEQIDFVEVPACEYKILEYNADGRPSSKVNAALQEMAAEIDPAGNLVLLKVKGELSSGKTSDIEFSSLARSLEDRGAIQVLMNHHQLTTKEYASIKVVGETTRDIETKVFSESIASLKLSNAKLKGQSGVKLSLALLDQLKREKKDNEGTAEYKSRLASEGLEILGIPGEMEEA